MPLLKIITFFVVSIIFNLILLSLFSLDLYFFYFLSLVIFLYILYRSYKYFSIILFSLFSILTIFVINLEFYNVLVVELFLYYDLAKESIYINSDVMYVLILLHYFFLVNLKKFENFWDIIDSRLLYKGWG